MPYPDKCIRGIAKEDFLFEGGPAARMTLYPFHGVSSTNEGWLEESINWMDDAYAIDYTLKQKNDDEELLFPVGVAILPLIQLNIIKRRHIGFFGYERKAIENINKYHGNLLLRANIKKERKRMIRDVLAYISEVHRREDIINQRMNKPRWPIVVRRLIKRCRNFIFSSYKSLG